MIVYAERSRRASTADYLKEISTLTDPVERLIAFGEWEAGVTDALFPAHDGITELTRMMRGLSLELGQGELQRLLSFDLPAGIEINVPEGYAFYALYPEQYAEAARQFSASCAPRHCWVIGIRSIGTSLSGVVGAELRKGGCVVDSFTVRPRGHPFDRFISLSPQLEKVLHEDIQSWFAIVDEGPGLSGSSFTSTAAKLSELGVANDRMVLFPSWLPNAEGFRSEKARQLWPRLLKYAVPFRPEWAVPSDSIDLSGGNWRKLVYPSDLDLPAVQPQHERRKYLAHGLLWKFCGLGRYGIAKLQRALQLSKAGFTPPVRGFRNGFLCSDYVAGSPLHASDLDEDLLQRLAEYLTFVKRQFPASGCVPYTAMRQMICTNTSHDYPANDALIEAGELTAVDGRMLPHEWIQTDRGLLKTDAVDHHNDHFFPGCQDITWDLAGASIEFRMSAQQNEQFITAYLKLQPDSTLRLRLEFYRLAYLAYRIGYVSMAAQSLGQDDDRRRFEDLHAYYSRALREMKLA